MTDNVARTKTVAFYLPQFHPTPENDGWWGPGFSEWHTVARARPLYRGHAQPRLPGGLGFYDLRLEETVRDQARLASESGVDAWCYWHYWFAGRQVLDRPAREQLGYDGLPVQFCFGWANEDWTRVWSGAPRQKLLEQTYPGGSDDRAHFDYLEPFFHSDRHLRVDGKPVFYIYRPAKHTHLQAFTDLWRSLAQQSGLPGIYFVGEVDSSAAGMRTNVQSLDALADVSWRRAIGLLGPLRKRLPPRPLRLPYRSAMDRWARISGDDILGVIMTGWDNTPRRAKTGWLLTAASPEEFGRHADAMLARAARHRHRLVFIKSWNEWSEGNILEPDATFGYDYLAALRKSIERVWPAS
jgi:lipopolysaccharide biosynthesis protein